MSAQMASLFLWLGWLSVLFCCTSGVSDEVGDNSDLPEKKPFSIEHLENGPEFLVNVPGIENPLCFNAEPKEETVRVLQDPKTGVIVNAQIFYDNFENKTYIGAVLIAKDNLCVLATQFVVLVNNARFNWGETRDMMIDGHKVVISEDMIVVAFRQSRITLIVQRHCPMQENSMDYSETSREVLGKPNGDNINEEESKGDTETEYRPLAMPVIGYQESRSFINNYLSSKRRRGIILQKFFGINKDTAVVRNVMIEVDTEGRKKRGNLLEDSSLAPKDEFVVDEGDEHKNQLETDNSIQKHREMQQKQNIQKPHHMSKRQQRDSIDDNRMAREAENRRDSSIFLDIYVADFRDFSNKTHGLLGQFVFKNVTREKIRYKDGKMTARLHVQENPGNRTYALFTSRFYAPMNATRACWKLRKYGQDVLDGKYSDYVVPSIWYRNLKELPPPAPL